MPGDNRSGGRQGANRASRCDVRPRASVTRELNEWTQEALASGVPFDLALLGRAVRRHHVAMQWTGEEPGLDWREMIDEALSDPAGTRGRWRRLLGVRLPACCSRSQ